MSQDSHQEEIKTIEQWKWSEMQGLELLSSPPFNNNSNKANNNQSTTEQEQEAGAEAEQGTREMENSASSSSSSSAASDPKKDGHGGGEKKPSDVTPVGFGELFRFADNLDYVLMAIGSLGAFVHGCSFPFFLRFFADLVNSFGSNVNNMDKMMQEVLKYALYFLVVGAAIWASSWAEISCWMWTGERQSTKMRIKYLEAALNQDI